MTPDQFQRVKALFLELRSRPFGEAAARLEDDPSVDDAIRAEVLSMLRSERSEDDDEAMVSRVIRAGDRAVLGEQTTAMPHVGRRVGNYEVVRVLGKGGMGVVYLCRDTRLGRQAALKAILPGGSDVRDRLTRLRREARLLASLSHPNLATVYGLEEDHGTLFLAMELVDGKSFSAKLGREPMPLEDAINVFAQIASGLEEAHDAGVVHRDLKPGNVVFTSDGVPKVLDFGLARDVSDADRAITDTIDQLSLTHTGTLFGTPAYMSPEQIRGEPLDRRTDIFSFGVMLFRALAGQLPFSGETGEELVGSIMNDPPAWGRLPARVPESLREILRRCLAKSLDQRYRHIGDVRLDLLAVADRRDWELRPNEGRAAPLWRRLLPWAAAATCAAAATAMLMRPVVRHEIDPAAQFVHRFDVGLPEQAGQRDLERLHVSLSPNGMDMVVACSTPAAGQQLWRRSHHDGRWQPISGTSGAHRPSITLDGDAVGFFAGDYFFRQTLRGRGESGRLAPSTNWYGASWLDDATVAYAPVWGSGLQLAGPAGVKPLTEIDTAAGEFAHVSPHVVQGSRWVLYAVWTGREDSQIKAVHLDTGKTHAVLGSGSTPRVVTSPRGTHMLFERHSNLIAVRFDPETATVSGPETTIAEGVLNDGTRFSAYYDVAKDGTLVYFPGSAFTEENRLSFVDATGSAIPVNEDRLSFAEPSFSPDQSKLSVILKGKLYRLMLYDLKRQTKQFILTGGDTVAQTLSPDGHVVAASVNRDGGYGVDLFSLADGSHLRRVVPPGVDYQSDLSWSPDGKTMTFTMAATEAAPRDIWIVDTDGSTPAKPFVATAAAEMNGTISPDGKWFAYVSEISGRREVYVTTFPEPTRTRQITFDGGEAPAWSPDGEGIFYVTGDKLVRIDLTADGEVDGRPTVIRTEPFGQSDPISRNYTIAPDGRPVVVEASEKRPTIDHLSVIVPWYRALP